MCRDAGWRLQEEIDREQAEQGPAPSQEETGEVSRRHTLVINIDLHLYMFDKVQSAWGHTRGPILHELRIFFSIFKLLQYSIFRRNFEIKKSQYW